MSNLKIKGPLSGFPEFLPELRRVELQWLDTIRQTFESYGFAEWAETKLLLYIVSHPH